MDVVAALVAGGQPAVAAVEPGEGALDHPAVAAESIFRLDPSTGDSGRDASNAAARSAKDMVVSLVGVQLGGAAPRSTAGALNRRDFVEHPSQYVAFVDVGGRDVDGEGHAMPIDDQVLFGAELAAVRRVRAGLRTPPFARTLEASSEARDQSILPARLSSSRRIACSFSHTPASCQSRSLRQQVIPLPQPISRGRYSQPIPVRRTKMIPARAARSSSEGRPPRGLGRAGGINGEMRAQRASGTRGFATIQAGIQALEPGPSFVRRS